MLSPPSEIMRIIAVDIGYTDIIQILLHFHHGIPHLRSSSHPFLWGLHLLQHLLVLLQGTTSLRFRGMRGQDQLDLLIDDGLETKLATKMAGQKHS